MSVEEYLLFKELCKQWQAQAAAVHQNDRHDLGRAEALRECARALGELLTPELPAPVAPAGKRKNGRS